MRKHLVVLGVLFAAVPALALARASGGVRIGWPTTRDAVVDANAGKPAGFMVQGAETWRLLSPSPSEFLAVHTTAVTTSAPFFETVRLARYFGTRLVTCGAMPGPTVMENGTMRAWQYGVARPTSGPCTGAGAGDFIVVGTRNGQDSPTARVP